jgi:hypothetical protein
MCACVRVQLHMYIFTERQHALTGTREREILQIHTLTLHNDRCRKQFTDMQHCITNTPSTQSNSIHPPTLPPIMMAFVILLPPPGKRRSTVASQALPPNKNADAPKYKTVTTVEEKAFLTDYTPRITTTTKFSPPRELYASDGRANTVPSKEREDGGRDASQRRF